MSSPEVTSSGSWSTTAKGYSANVGQSTGAAALRLVELVENLKPISASSYILDNGAGTGPVTQVLVSHHPSTRVLATDLSGPMLSVIDKEQYPNVKTQVLDARSLSKELQPVSFSHAFNTFMLQTITDPLTALREMHHVLQPGGVIGIAIWAKEVDVFTIWTKACKSIDPDYQMPPPLDDDAAWRTPEELGAALAETGFTDLKFDYCKMPFAFDSAEAFAQFWFGEKNPGATKVIDAYKGDLALVRSAMERVVREEYSDGSNIYLAGVLGVGRKGV